MSRAPRPNLTLPKHWTPAQALAAFELLDLLRDAIWTMHGPAIQRAMRNDRRPCDPRQLHIDLDSDGDDPF